MPLFAQESLNPGVRKREVFGWATYDFANSGYTTVVLTAVFNAYFVGVVAGGADWATLAWTLALAVSNVIVMLTVPAIGAYADLRAAKKRLLALATVGCVVTTALLGLVGPGELWLAVFAVVLSNAFYSYGEALNAAFLPELSRPDALGRVSGWGWSFGYFGGMLALGLSLAYVLWAQGQGQQASQFVPVTMWITAAVYALAALVTFALLPERAVPQGAWHTLARPTRGQPFTPASPCRQTGCSRGCSILSFKHGRGRWHAHSSRRDKRSGSNASAHGPRSRRSSPSGPRGSKSRSA